MIRKILMNGLIVLALVTSGCGKSAEGMVPDLEEPTEAEEYVEDLDDLDEEMESTKERPGRNSSSKEGSSDSCNAESSDEKDKKTNSEKNGNTTKSDDKNTSKTDGNTSKTAGMEQESLTTEETGSLGNVGSKPQGNGTGSKSPDEKDHGKSVESSSTDNGNNSVEANTHTSCSWNVGSITKQPTCKSEGTKTFTCTVCEVVKTESIVKTNHSYTSETIAATCTTGGSSKTVCSICGDVQSEVSSGGATGHSMVDSWFGNPPTCTTGGYLNRYCSNCDWLEISSSFPPIDHNKVGEQFSVLWGCMQTNGVKYSCKDCKLDLGTEETSTEFYHNWVTGDIDGWGEERVYCNECFTGQ